MTCVKHVWTAMLTHAHGYPIPSHLRVNKGPTIKSDVLPLRINLTPMGLRRPKYVINENALFAWHSIKHVLHDVSFPNATLASPTDGQTNETRSSSRDINFLGRRNEFGRDPARATGAPGSRVIAHSAAIALPSDRSIDCRTCPPPWFATRARRRLIARRLFSAGSSLFGGALSQKGNCVVSSPCRWTRRQIRDGALLALINASV